MTANTFNGNTIATGSGTLNLNSKNLTLNKTMSFTANDDTGVYTLPTGTKTLVATDVTALNSLGTVSNSLTGMLKASSGVLSTAT